MSIDSPNIEIPKEDARKLTIGLVSSRYNSALMERLFARVQERLVEIGVSESCIHAASVPGSNELPYSVNEMVRVYSCDCVIAIGVVIAGDTHHHHTIADATANALQHISIQSRVPVINGILTVEQEAQAHQRITGAHDRGAEYANAAVFMAVEKLKFQKKASRL